MTVLIQRHKAHLQILYRLLCHEVTKADIAGSDFRSVQITKSLFFAVNVSLTYKSVLPILA
jgi:hypothetical protein